MLLCPCPVLLIRSWRSPSLPLVWLRDEGTLRFRVIRGEDLAKVCRAVPLWQWQRRGRAECSPPRPPDSLVLALWSSHSSLSVRF